MDSYFENLNKQIIDIPFDDETFFFNFKNPKNDYLLNLSQDDNIFLEQKNEDFSIILKNNNNSNESGSSSSSSSSSRGEKRSRESYAVKGAETVFVAENVAKKQKLVSKPRYKKKNHKERRTDQEKKDKQLFFYVDEKRKKIFLPIVVTKAHTTHTFQTTYQNLNYNNCKDFKEHVVNDDVHVPFLYSNLNGGTALVFMEEDRFSPVLKGKVIRHGTNLILSEPLADNREMLDEYNFNPEWRDRLFKRFVWLESDYPTFCDFLKTIQKKKLLDAEKWNLDKTLKNFFTNNFDKEIIFVPTATYKKAFSCVLALDYAKKHFDFKPKHREVDYTGIQLPILDCERQQKELIDKKLIFDLVTDKLISLGSLWEPVRKWLQFTK